VNNAGIQHVAPLTEFPEAKWRLLIELMLTAPFLLTKAALPGMYERGWGRIVNIGSVHSLRASAFKSAYVSAKHGLLGLTRVTALEGAEHGVTCNCVCPSYVRTALVEKQIADQARVHGIPESEVVEKIMVAEAAIHRLLEPSEVAGYIAFLCSDAASGVTGSAVTIDCGWTAR
jgi:3-hydroxybutyrate dehydrogenase